MRYQVPVRSIMLDVYDVEAKSSSEAGYLAGRMIDKGVPPSTSTIVSTQMMSAKRQHEPITANA